MTANIQKTAITEAQARQLTDRIKSAADQLWALLLQAHESKAWTALGYKNWRDYAVAEFSVSQSRAYQLLDQAVVVTAIQEAANSTMVEISERAAREIKPVIREVAKEISAKVAAGGEPVTTTYTVIEAKRAELRPAPEAPATPVAKPEVQAKPKKGEPTIQSLLAEKEALQEDNQRLRDELHEARHVAGELADDLESYNTASEGEVAYAKELTRLKGMLRTVEGSRDQYMAKANEATKSAKFWKAKAERSEKAVQK